MKQPGKLFYVIGPSGAGKDSLMHFARQQLNGQFPTVFAHRYITRSAEAGGENYISLSPEEFRMKKALGHFAMHWHSHGNDYGIGKEINYWLESGCQVVVNGSRGYLPEASLLYPQMQVVLVHVDTKILQARLLVRGRESEEEIAQRLQRSAQFAAIDYTGLILLDNSGSLAAAGDQLIALLTQEIRNA